MKCNSAKGGDVRVLVSFVGRRPIATTQRCIDVNDDLMRAAVWSIGLMAQARCWRPQGR